MKRLQTALPDRLKRWFFVLLAANVLFIVLAGLYLQPLTTGEIIKFELAKDVSTAESIVDHWIAAGLLDKARTSLYLDFLFIVLYTSGLSVTCLLLSRITLHEVLARTGYFMVYLLMAAGICDVIENVALLKRLHGTIENWNVILAYDMAATKFSILILCLLFCAVCLVFRMFRNA